MKNKEQIINGYTVKSPKLTHKPNAFFYDDRVGKIINVNRVALAKKLSREYQYKEYVLNEDEKVSQVRRDLEKLSTKELHIIVHKRRKKPVIVDYAFCDKNYGFNRAFELNSTRGIVAGFKQHNASKKFKLRQAVGRDKVERFRLHSMGIK